MRFRRGRVIVDATSLMIDEISTRADIVIRPYRRMINDIHCCDVNFARDDGVERQRNDNDRALCRGGLTYPPATIGAALSTSQCQASQSMMQASQSMMQASHSMVQASQSMMQASQSMMQASQSMMQASHSMVQASHMD
jgi:hypothetical protein